MRWIKRLVKLGILGAILVGLYFGWHEIRKLIHVELPHYAAPRQVRWAEGQNWSEPVRDMMHRADQGTTTFAVPYEWFVALEQPVLSLFAAGKLADPEYLDRIGFIVRDTGKRQGELPIGFAHGAAWVDPTTGGTWRNPATGAVYATVGLTCAACHTGRLQYQGTELRIDGAPALTDLGKFRKALGLSLAFTKYVPFRFGRFARAVLGDNASDAAVAALKQQFESVLQAGNHEFALETKAAAHSVEEGYGRLDALNRIGNQVFALDLGVDANYAATSAPVRYPRIWHASWLDWVQYNGSIMQPMVRNAGEALGVRALVNLTNPSRPWLQSAVQVKGIYQIEQWLAGEKPPHGAHAFSGLRPPTWPADLFDPIDTKLAAYGERLYRELCQGCHLPPMASDDFWRDEHWTPAKVPGQRYIRTHLIPLNVVGTDPAQAEDMRNRTVQQLPEALATKGNGFGPALGELVEQVVNHWYNSQVPPTPPEERERMNGYRPNGIRDPLAYRARPLDGVWATPPYLHNGSVPNIFALLSPPAERPVQVYLGDRQYDPKLMGYSGKAELPGGFALDTTRRGNWNTGHEFADDKGRLGVIGRALSVDERMALIEFLKTQ